MLLKKKKQPKILLLRLKKRVLSYGDFLLCNEFGPAVMEHWLPGAWRSE